MVDTHLTIVSICLDKDPFKTRLDVMDVVTVLQLQRAEGTGEQIGSIWNLRQFTGYLGTCVILSWGTLCFWQFFPE